MHELSQKMIVATFEGLRKVGNKCFYHNIASTCANCQRTVSKSVVSSGEAITHCSPETVLDVDAASVFREKGTCWGLSWLFDFDPLLMGEKFRAFDAGLPLPSPPEEPAAMLFTSAVLEEADELLSFDASKWFDLVVASLFLVKFGS